MTMSGWTMWVDDEARINFEHLSDNSELSSTCDFKWKDLTVEEIMALSSKLMINTRCKNLILAGNDLTSDTIEILIEGLRQNSSVVNLDLKFTKIDDECGELLLSLMQDRTFPLNPIVNLGTNLSIEMREKIKEVYEIKSTQQSLIERKKNLEKRYNTVVEESPPTDIKFKKNENVDIKSTKTIKISNPEDKLENNEKPFYTPKPIRSRSPRRKKNSFDEYIMKWQSSTPLTPEEAKVHVHSMIDDPENALDFLLKIHLILHQDRGVEINFPEKPSISSKVKMIDLRQVQINEKLNESGTNTGVFSCYIDGWNCVMNEIGLSGSEEEIQKYDTEIKLLEKLPRHPNIVRYLHHERKGEKLRLYLSRYSSTLGDYLKNYRVQFKLGRQEHFTPIQMLNYTKQLAAGISFLHQNNIIHRDLNSQNIFIKYDEHRDIMGIVIGDIDSSKRISLSNKVVGSISYLAPEIISLGGTNYSYEADIWSFGMVLFEILTLCPPFIDEDPLKIPERITEGHLPVVDDLIELNGDYNGLVELHEICTSLSPHERPTIDVVKKEIRKMLQSFNL